MKTRRVFIGINDILTEPEIKQVRQLMRSEPLAELHRAIRAAVIDPNMERINTALGQENDPDYLAYMVEYLLTGR